MASFVAQLHNSLANTMILYMAVCGLWGIFGAFRGGVSGSYAGTLVLAEGLILAQGILGIIAYLVGLRPAHGLHFLYGLSAAITLPAVYSFTRTRSPQQQSLWFGAAGLFIVGLAIRGITTGRA